MPRGAIAPVNRIEKPVEEVVAVSIMVGRPHLEYRSRLRIDDRQRALEIEDFFAKIPIPVHAASLVYGQETVVYTVE